MEKLDKIVEIQSEDKMNLKLTLDQRQLLMVLTTTSLMAEEVEVRGTKRMLKEKSKKASGSNMWLSAIKLAVSAGSKIYANKQKTKMAMSDAQLMHASRMAEGKEAYQGKLLEARQSDWKDEAVLIILSAPMQFWRGQSYRGPNSDGQGKIVLRHVLSSSHHGSQIYGSLSWRAFMV